MSHCIYDCFSRFYIFSTVAAKYLPEISGWRTEQCQMKVPGWWPDLNTTCCLPCQPGGNVSHEWPCWAWDHIQILSDSSAFDCKHSHHSQVKPRCQIKWLTKAVVEQVYFYIFASYWKLYSRANWARDARVSAISFSIQSSSLSLLPFPLSGGKRKRRVN